MSSPSNVRRTTRSIITLTEAQSGKQVIVQDDPNLQTFASVAMARGEAPAHVIRYKPVPNEDPDYLIAYQCGFVLRKFSVPPEDRVDFASSSTGLDIVTRLFMNNHGKAGRISPDKIRELAKHVFDGLMIHLLSVPVGLRVGRWLRAEYPDLIPLQDRYILRELDTNERSNTPETRRLMPKKVFDATQTINAAYALYWADEMDQADVPDSYRPYRRDAERLLEILEEIPAEPEADQSLIDAWGEALHLQPWYQWVPFRG